MLVGGSFTMAIVVVGGVSKEPLITGLLVALVLAAGSFKFRSISTVTLVPDVSTVYGIVAISCIGLTSKLWYSFAPFSVSVVIGTSLVLVIRRKDEDRSLLPLLIPVFSSHRFNLVASAFAGR